MIEFSIILIFLIFLVFLIRLIVNNRKNTEFIERIKIKDYGRKINEKTRLKKL